MNAASLYYFITRKPREMYIKEEEKEEENDIEKQDMRSHVIDIQLDELEEKVNDLEHQIIERQRILDLLNVKISRLISKIFINKSKLS